MHSTFNMLAVVVVIIMQLSLPAIWPRQQCCLRNWCLFNCFVKLSDLTTTIQLEQSLREIVVVVFLPMNLIQLWLVRGSFLGMIPMNFPMNKEHWCVDIIKGATFSSLGWKWGAKRVVSCSWDWTQLMDIKPTCLFPPNLLHHLLGQHDGIIDRCNTSGIVHSWPLEQSNAICSSESFNDLLG